MNVFVKSPKYAKMAPARTTDIQQYFFAPLMTLHDLNHGPKVFRGRTGSDRTPGS